MTELILGVTPESLKATTSPIAAVDGRRISTGKRDTGVVTWRIAVTYARGGTAAGTFPGAAVRVRDAAADDCTGTLEGVGVLEGAAVPPSAGALEGAAVLEGVAVLVGIGVDVSVGAFLGHSRFAGHPPGVTVLVGDGARTKVGRT